MKKIALVIHGGASHISPFMRKHRDEYAHGLKIAIAKGYSVLQKNGSAMDAVQEAVVILEDYPYFNAGRGSALNARGEVEMDASIMDGRTLEAGAVAMIRRVKNPVLVARAILEDTKHVFLAGYGALEFAKQKHIPLKNQSYFITPHEYDEFKKTKHAKNRSKSGTVGAVALDYKGNVAAATSTGGISLSLPSRIGDSCIIGAGCYANNKTCAISGTGEGELLIEGVVAHTISMIMELKKCSLQQACDYVVFKRNKHVKGEIGVIGVSKNGDIGLAYNCGAMKSASISWKTPLNIKLW